MSIPKLMRLVQNSLTNDLRKKKYQNKRNKLAGHCYVATEALWHLFGGPRSVFKPMVMTINGDTHWFLRGRGMILDVTLLQYRTIPKYNTARGCGFLTSKPSKRAQIVIKRVEAQLAGWSI